jgi:hypothetical protein
VSILQVEPTTAEKPGREPIFKRKRILFHVSREVKAKKAACKEDCGRQFEVLSNSKPKRQQGTKMN